MSQTVSASAQRTYGLARVCKVWRLSRATLSRHRSAANRPTAPRRRPGPPGAMPDAALARSIRALLQDSPFHGEGYRKVWARLRYSGVRTSPRRVLRVMREHRLLAHQRPGSPRGPRAHDGTITMERVDEMWGTDMTAVVTGEGQAAVFIAVDHCSAECVGIHASPRATRHEALEPIRQAVRGSFGAVAQGVAKGVSIRHDHGSQYMSADFQREIRFIGARSSPAFVRAPEGNGCAERFIRTLKENLLWVRWFETIEDLRRALLEFQKTYNKHWLIERHGHRQTAAIRQEQTINMQSAA
jgi:transposase InsO family protein